MNDEAGRQSGHFNSARMNLKALHTRRPPTPFAGESKIPWHEPAFSERMLREHLSQEHDRASRRFSTIDRQVAWIHETVQQKRPGRILELGCGPGMYLSRLARLGHRCTGIDFSPAAIAYAQTEADRNESSCEYQFRDIRAGDFGTGFDAVLFLYGEFNTFTSDDARSILAAARGALVDGGALVLEVHDEAIVREMGEARPTWFTAEQSVFADEPHVCLSENFWHPEARAATERHYVYPITGKDNRTYTSTTQAYSDAEYGELLKDADFPATKRFESLTGDSAGLQPGLFVFVAFSESTSVSEERPRESP